MTRMIFRDENKIASVLKWQWVNVMLSTLYTWYIQSSGYSKALNTVLWVLLCCDWSFVYFQSAQHLLLFPELVKWWLLPTNHFTEWHSLTASHSVSRLPVIQSVRKPVSVLQDYCDRDMEYGSLFPSLSLSLLHVNPLLQFICNKMFN